MITDFVVEDYLERIYHEKTKIYFQEVYSSYRHGNFRSAIVMLYSVVICDLVYKLQELHDIYQDAVAEKIITEIEAKQEDKESRIKSTWEEYLIDQIEAKTLMFSTSEMTNIRQLRSHRHLSAHPVMNNYYELLSPSPETTLSHIRNMLEGVLTKNPVISKKLFPTILSDLQAKKSYLTLDSDLSNYLNSRYYKNFNNSLFDHIAKNLWDITFRCTSHECEVNRDINFRALKVLIQGNPIQFSELLKKETVFLSRFNTDRAVLLKLIDLICEFDFIYNDLESHAQTVINLSVQKDVSLTIKAYFLCPSLDEHFNMLSRKFHGYPGQYFNQPYTLSHVFQHAEMAYLYHLAKRKGKIDQFLYFSIDHFAHSMDFHSSIYLFDNVIRVYLHEFSIGHIEKLISAIDYNPQIYSSYECGHQCKIIKEYADKNGLKINYSKYPNFK
ncbi:hypothetical protein ACFSR7_01990 [Cohnella sp. GCM10020058]|uniref:hypothetical protein n=1 Tax=Cohnella sp. GCM10020058 TaxID=3317330 RepID=UPI003640FA2C